MAGNRKFHNKFHSANHHTIPSPHIIDSGLDPIASHDFPFIGDFVLNGTVSGSNNYLLNGLNSRTLTLDSFRHGLHPTDLGLPGNWNIFRDSTYIDGDAVITGNLSAVGELTYLHTQVYSTSANEIDVRADNSNGKSIGLRVDQYGANDVLHVYNDAISTLIITGSADQPVTNDAKNVGGQLGINLGSLNNVDRPNQRMTIVGSVSVTGDPYEYLDQNQQTDPGVTGSLYIEGGLHVNNVTYLDELVIDTTDGKTYVSGAGVPGSENPLDVDVPILLDRVTIDTSDGDTFITGTNKVYVDTTQGLVVDTHTQLDQLTVDTTDGDMLIDGNNWLKVEVPADFNKHVNLDRTHINTDDGSFVVSGSNKVYIDTTGGLDVDTHTQLDQLTVDTTDGKMYVKGDNILDVESHTHLDQVTIDTTFGKTHISGNQIVDIESHTNLDQVTIDTDSGKTYISGSNILDVDTAAELDQVTINTTDGKTLITHDSNFYDDRLPVDVDVPVELTKTTVDTTSGDFSVVGTGNFKLAHEGKFVVETETELNKLTVDVTKGDFLIKGKSSGNIFDINVNTSINDATLSASDVHITTGVDKNLLVDGGGRVDYKTEVFFDNEVELDKTSIDTTDGEFRVHNTDWDEGRSPWHNVQEMNVNVPTLLQSLTASSDNEEIVIEGTNKTLFYTPVEIHRPVLMTDTVDMTDQVRVNNLSVSGFTDLDETHIDTTDGDFIVSGSGDTNIKTYTVFDKSVYIKGNLRVDGNAWLSAGYDGKIYVGDTDGDNVIFHADIDSDMLPNLQDTWRLGRPGKRWLDVNSFAGTFSEIFADNTLYVDGKTELDETEIITDDGSFIISGSNPTTFYTDVNIKSDLTLEGQLSATKGPWIFTGCELNPAYHSGSVNPVDQTDGSTDNVSLTNLPYHQFQVDCNSLFSRGLTANGPVQIGELPEGVTDELLEPTLEVLGNLHVREGNIKIVSDIRHLEDENTLIRFKPDAIEFRAGDAPLLTLTEKDAEPPAGRDIVEIGSQDSPADLKIYKQSETEPEAITFNSETGETRFDGNIGVNGDNEAAPVIGEGIDVHGSVRVTETLSAKNLIVDYITVQEDSFGNIGGSGSGGGSELAPVSGVATANAITTEYVEGENIVYEGVPVGISFDITEEQNTIQKLFSFTFEAQTADTDLGVSIGDVQTTTYQFAAKWDDYWSEAFVNDVEYGIVHTSDSPFAEVTSVVLSATDVPTNERIVKIVVKPSVDLKYFSHNVLAQVKPKRLDTVTTADFDVNGDLSVFGQVSAAQGLTVDGDHLLKGEVTYLSAATFEDDVTFKKHVDIEELAIGDGGLYVKGDLRVDGNAYLSAGAGGIINVGDTNTDNVVFHADVDSNLIPNIHRAFDLGSRQAWWKESYIWDTFVDTISSPSFYTATSSCGDAFNTSSWLQPNNVSSVDGSDPYMDGDCIHISETSDYHKSYISDALYDEDEKIYDTGGTVELTYTSDRVAQITSNTITLNNTTVSDYPVGSRLLLITTFSPTEPHSPGPAPETCTLEINYDFTSAYGGGNNTHTLLVENGVPVRYASGTEFDASETKVDGDILTVELQTTLDSNGTVSNVRWKTGEMGTWVDINATNRTVHAKRGSRYPITYDFDLPTISTDCVITDALLPDGSQHKDSVGNWEYVTVESHNGDKELVLRDGIIKQYSTENYTFVAKPPRFKKLIVEQGTTLTGPGWTGDDQVLQGVVSVIADTAEIRGTIDMIGKGYRGGNIHTSTANGTNSTGGRGESFHSGIWNVKSRYQVEGSGGGGSYVAVTGGDWAGGGGGGGYGTDGTNGATGEKGYKGTVFGDDFETRIFMGPGGGQGGTDSGYPHDSGKARGGYGGPGGGIIILDAMYTKIHSTGILNTRGGNGFEAYDQGDGEPGNGGGGAGGGILITGDMNNAGNISTSGGIGKKADGSGQSGGWGNSGGDGGNGRTAVQGRLIGNEPINTVFDTSATVQHVGESVSNILSGEIGQEYNININVTETDSPLMMIVNDELVDFADLGYNSFTFVAEQESNEIILRKTTTGDTLFKVNAIECTRKPITVFTSPVTAEHDVQINGNLDVQDNIHGQSDFRLDGNASLSGTLTVGDNTTLQKNLNVSGHSHLQDTVTIDGRTQINNNTEITGTQDVSGTIHTADDLRVDGDTFLSGGVHIGCPDYTDLKATLKYLIHIPNHGNPDVAAGTEEYTRVVDLSAHQQQIVDYSFFTSYYGDPTWTPHQPTSTWNLYNLTIQVSGEDFETDPISVTPGNISIPPYGTNTNPTSYSYTGTIDIPDISAYLPSALSVCGSVVMGNDLHVKGDLRVDGNAYLSAGAGGVINVGDSDDDNVVFRGDIDSNLLPNVDSAYDLGAINPDKRWRTLHTRNVSAVGTIDLVGSLDVYGDSDLDGKLDVTKIAHLYDDLRVDGDTFLSGAATVDQDILGKSNLTIEGNTHLGGTADVVDTIHGQSDLHIDGVTHLSGAAIIDDDLLVTGTTKLSGHLEVDDHADIHGDVNTHGLTASGNIYGKENLTVDKHAQINETMNVVGNAKFDSNVHIKGDLRVDGNAYLSAGASGSINVGDTETDIVIFNADIGSDVVPDVSDSFDLGKPGKTWNEVHWNGGNSLESNSVYDFVNSTSGEWGYANLSAYQDDSYVLRHDQVPPLAITHVRRVTNSSLVTTLKDLVYRGDIVLVADTEDNLVAIVDHPTGEYDKDIAEYTGYERLFAPGNMVRFINGHQGPSVTLDPDDLDDTDSAHKFVAQGEIDNLHSVYTNVQASSAARESVYSTVNALSTEWDWTYGTVYHHHQNWEETRLTLNALSANWNSCESTVFHTSGDWNDTRTTLGATSGDWNDTRSTVMNTSGTWDSVYSFVNGDSATNNTNYNQTTFVNASGDNITGDLNVAGTLSGTHAYFTTMTALSSYIDVVDIKVRELSGFDIIDGDLTVQGDISATGDVYLDKNSLIFSDAERFNSQDSKNAKSVYGSVLATSADWNDTRTTLNTSSGDWYDTRTTLNASSGDWYDTRTTLGTTSADWNDARTTLGSTSGDWNDTRSTVMATSGVYNTVKASSADWYDTRSTVMATSGVYNTVNASSGDWYDARTTLGTTSGDWNDTRSSVMNTSGTWNSVYSHVNNTSGYGYATVGADGLLEEHLVPNLSITETYVVTYDDSVADLCSGQLQGPVDIERGDVVIITATEQNLIAVVDNPTGEYNVGFDTFDGFSKLQTPTDYIKTINGKQGLMVTLNPDDLDDEVTAHKFVDELQKYNWDSTFATVCAASAEWDSVYTSVNETSGEWDSVYSFVNSDSATNNTDYNQTTFVNASGDTVTGDLVIEDTLTVEGSTLASSLEVTNGTSLNTLDVNNNATFHEHVHIKGDLRVDGNAYLSAGAGGIINVGDTNTDNVMFHADVDSNFLADKKDTYTLGSEAKRWLATYSLSGLFHHVDIHDLNVSGVANINDLDVSGVTKLTGKTDERGPGIVVRGTPTGIFDLDPYGFDDNGVPRADYMIPDVDIVGDVALHGSLSADNAHIFSLTASYFKAEYQKLMINDGDLEMLNGNIKQRGGNVLIESDLGHVDDENTYMRFQPDEITFYCHDVKMLQFQELTTGDDLITIGDVGDAVDIIVQNPTDNSTLYIDGDKAYIGIGTDTPAEKLHVATGQAQFAPGDQSGAVMITSGTTDERVDKTGSIRWNSEVNRYEGYRDDTKSWVSLQSIGDTDGDTYVSVDAGDYPDSDRLSLYTAGCSAMTMYPNQTVAFAGDIQFDNITIYDNDSVTGPLSATTEFIYLKVNGKERAIRLWATPEDTREDIETLHGESVTHIGDECGLGHGGQIPTQTISAHPVLFSPPTQRTGLDTDGDGIIDYLDPDDDGDGIPDYMDMDHALTEGMNDSDGDNIADPYDTDRFENNNQWNGGGMLWQDILSTWETLTGSDK